MIVESRRSWKLKAALSKDESRLLAMFIAQVIGNIVCTQKDEGLAGMKLLVVQPLKDDRTAKGKPLIAIDTIRDAGYGDLVYLSKSKESSIPLDKELVPSDAGIMGIIDDYYIHRMEE